MPTAEEMSPRVDQATGMVSVQAECSMVDALGMMKDRAQVERRSLTDVAIDVLERTIRFGP